MPIPVLGLDLKYGPRRDLLLDRLRDALLHQEPRCTTVNHFEFDRLTTSSIRPAK